MPLRVRMRRQIFLHNVAKVEISRRRIPHLVEWRIVIVTGDIGLVDAFAVQARTGHKDEACPAVEPVKV